MNKGFVLGLLMLAFVGCTSNPTAPPGFQSASTVWVVNSLGESLSKVELDSGQVVTNAILLDSAPNDIVISGNLAYVVNSLSNNVQVFDLALEQTVGTIEILKGINPYYIALDNQQRAFVSNWMTGNVSVLDLQSGLESDAITTGGVPQGLCVVDSMLFVTDVNFDMGSSTYGPGRLLAFSLTSLELVNSLEVGTNPQTVVLGPDEKLHVVCTGIIGTGTGRIDIVDPQTLTLERSISIGGSPGALAFNSQHVAYLASVAMAGEGRLLTYDALTYAVLNGTSNPIVLPSSVMDVACTADDHIFAACFNTDELVELDENNTIVREFTVGHGPIALALAE